MERVFSLTIDDFHERNFGNNALSNRIMGTRFDVEVARHFHPDVVKFLPEEGIEPIVLTAANPSVPVTDDSLVHDVPEGTRIARARTFEPDYRLKKVAWDARAEKRRTLSARAKNLATSVAKEALI